MPWSQLRRQNEQAQACPPHHERTVRRAGSPLQVQKRGPSVPYRQLACEKGPIQVDGGSATFFPDFTLAIQTLRATFLEVKLALREEGLRYSLLYPSTLKDILDGDTYFFQEPDEVWAWVEAYHKGHTDFKQTEHKQPETPRKVAK
ncbi:hypothetical protein NDU88_010947 [Pleurodeles waltl]|uniref:Uncharacterized protein n=1 Tax=Pleurodeles waltl TaxID=8319 RepID=A0AAV7R208_PLEWA|nr:hypothetical protein NDU88_010947 [Pleurodeles waltl]